MIQYFDWEKGGLQTKLLDVQSKPNGTAQIIVHYVHSILESNDLVYQAQCIASSGDNSNTVFGRVACASTYVFPKL